MAQLRAAPRPSATTALIGAYLVAIVAANLTVAWFGPAVMPLNALLLIGLDLTARDRLHDAWHGRHLWAKMATLIAAGSLLSALLNPAAGRIAAASFLAFALAGAVDTLSYHALRSRAHLLRINGSNLAAAAVDSLAFPTLAFGTFLPAEVALLFLAKTAGGLLWSLILTRRKP